MEDSYLFKKAQSVIESCNTLEQLMKAYNYGLLVINQLVKILPSSLQHIYSYNLQCKLDSYVLQRIKEIR